MELTEETVQSYLEKQHLVKQFFFIHSNTSVDFSATVSQSVLILSLIRMQCEELAAGESALPTLLMTQTISLFFFYEIIIALRPKYVLQYFQSLSKTSISVILQHVCLKPWHDRLQVDVLLISTRIYLYSKI